MQMCIILHDDSILLAINKAAVEGGEAMVLDIQKILLLTAEKRMNFTDVLKQAHISLRTAQRIRAGQELQTKTAGKLAEALGVRVADLLKE